MSSGNSYIFHNGDGSTTDFSFPFTYLSNDHVKASIGGVVTTAWTFIDGSNIRFDSAPAAGTENIKIFRETSPGTRLTNYQDAGTLGADELNVDSKQAFFLAQEAVDTSNLAGPEAAAAAQASETAAAASAAAALTSETNAAASEAAAAASAAALPNASSIGANNFPQSDGSAWSGLSAAQILGIILTTRGDLAVRGASAVSRLALGANGQALLSNGTDAVWGDVSSVLRGYFSGYTLSHNSVDDLHDVDIAAGDAASDDHDELISMTSSITKRIDASWSVGTGNGGLDTGTVANGSTYYLYVIKRTDTGVVDVLFSLSGSSPTMPANYDKKRLIGAVFTNDFANIIREGQFMQVFMDRKRYRSAEQDVTSLGQLVMPHALGAVPNSVDLTLVAQVAHVGFSIGDLSPLPPGVQSNTQSEGVNVRKDATNVTLRYGAAAASLRVIRPDTGITTNTANANWKLIIEAEVDV